MGTFFESVPSADAHILSNVIHDWPDEEAIQILENVRRVGRPGARLFLLEMILDGDTEPLLARLTGPEHVGLDRRARAVSKCV